MKTKELWSEKIDKPTDPNSQLTNQVFACTLLQDGNVLAVAVGDTLLIYDIEKSEMLRPPLRGYHKETINCLTSNKDGSKMASGGSDKIVIVWNYQEGKIDPENKYVQADSVYAVAFSPLKSQIFSGSSSDFVLWTPGMTQIDKNKYKEKIITAAWSGDGQTLAFGTINGTLVLTDRQASQLKEIVPSKVGPIWCMDWSPVTYEFQSSILTIGIWPNQLVNYDSNGQILIRMDIPMDPLYINYASNGEYFSLAGNNNKVYLYSRECAQLTEVCEANDWVLSTKLKPKSNILIYTTNDGEIAVREIIQGNVCSLFQDKFIQREQLTDALITQMVSGQKARIKCKELVRNVAIYKDKVAIMCGVKVLVYSCIIKSDDYMKYKLFKKFTKRLESDLFTLGFSNIMIAHGNKVIAFNFNGDMDRTWTLDGVVTIFTQCGGPQKRELLLVGTDQGSVYKIYLDNSFPILVHKSNQAIKALQMSMTKRKLALIDGNQNLIVIDLITKETIFGEMSVEGVAFNQDFEDLIAYSGKGLLFVKCIQFPALNQKINGNVIGFKGSKLFLQDGMTLQTIEIQQTANMIKYLEKKDFQNALKIACLGVTELDFRSLGLEALMAGEFDIARRCFVRNKDYALIELLQKYENQKLDPNTLNMLNAEAMAYQGKYMDAGNFLLKAGMADMAVKLFSDLKRWEDAKNFARRGDVVYRQQTAQSRAGTAGKRLGTGLNRGQPQVTNQQMEQPKIEMNKLLKEQGEWLKETGDWKGAAELFVSCGEYKKAIELYGQNKCVDPLIDLCRMMDRTDNNENIQLCAQYFKKLKHHGGAKEAYLKLNDLRNLVLLHIEFEHWQDAFIIARSNPDLKELVKVPYADFLLKEDRYEDALKAYKSANRYDITMKMTKDMSKNCLEERRYQDASQHLWNLATDCLQQIKNFQQMDGDDHSIYSQYLEYSDLAEIYFAYQKIHNFIEEPFQPLSGITYFQQIMNAARFIIGKWKPSYTGVKLNYVYYALAKTSLNLQCFRTANDCYTKLHTFKIPPEWSEEVDLQTMLCKSSQFTDDDSLLPICSRCHAQQKLTQNSDSCTSCNHPLISSQLSYAVLPLIEFTIPSTMSVNEFLSILNEEKASNSSGSKNAFNEAISQSIQLQQISDKKNDYVPIKLDESMIRMLEPEEVLIVDYQKYCLSMDTRYFRNMQPEIPLHLCSDCCRFFYLDEHQMEYVQKKYCPFCRTADKREIQKDIFDI